MDIIYFLVLLLHASFAAAILAFTIPITLVLYSRFKHRFKYSIPVAAVMTLIFLMNLNLLVAEHNKDLFPSHGESSWLVRLALPIGFIGFLILFGTDINRWKDDKEEQE